MTNISNCNTKSSVVPKEWTIYETSININKKMIKVVFLIIMIRLKVIRTPEFLLIKNF